MKKHAKTTGHEANMNQYLWALTFFQPRSSSVTNRTCADSEVTPSSYNTSANSCPTSTSPDPIRSLFKTTWSTKNQKLYWHSIAYLMGIVTIQHSTLGIFCMLYTLRVQKHMILKWDQSNWCMLPILACTPTIRTCWLTT